MPYAENGIGQELARKHRFPTTMPGGSWAISAPQGEDSVIDIRILRLFMRVAECGSISGAADELGMAQPVLSRQIRGLETELGATLFDRHARGVKPNANGRKLIAATRSIDANYKSALRDLADARTAALGRARIGATPSWLQKMVPTAAARVTRAVPSARLSIHVAPGPALLNQLLQGKLDLALVPLKTTRNYAGLVDVEVLSTVLYVVFGARADVAGDGRTVSLSAFADHQWVLPRQSHAREIFRDVHTDLGLAAPEPRIEVDNAEMVFEIAANSDLLSFGVLPTRGHRFSDRLSGIDCPELTTSVDHGCVTVRRATLDPLCTAFRQELRDVAAMPMGDADQQTPEHAD